MTCTNSGKEPVPMSQPHQANLLFTGHKVQTASTSGNCHIFSLKAQPVPTSEAAENTEAGVSWQGLLRPGRGAGSPASSRAAPAGEGASPSRAGSPGTLWHPQPAEPAGQRCWGQPRGLRRDPGPVGNSDPRGDSGPWGAGAAAAARALAPAAGGVSSPGEGRQGRESPR